MAGIQAVTVVAIGGAFVCGLVLALFAAHKLTLAEESEGGSQRIGSRLAALNLALVPMALLWGVLVDRWGVRGVVLCGSVLLTTALLALSVRPTFPRDFLALLLAGLGGSALWLASTIVMPPAFFGTALATASVNLGHVFFALGALVAPGLLEVLRQRLSLKKALVLFAFMCLLPAFPAALAGEGALEATGAAAREGRSGDWAAVLLPNEHVWLAGLVLFFYIPLEAAIGVRTTAYLVGYSQTRRPAAWMAAFWGAFVASRLLTALAQQANILPARYDAWFVVLLALLAAVALGNLSGTNRRSTARIGVVLLGLLLGPLFPTLVGVVLRNIPEDQGTALGVLFSLGSLGSLFLGPLLVGRKAPESVRAALRVPMVLALVLTAVALVFSLTMS
jgi:fucose permease